MTQFVGPEFFAGQSHFLPFPEAELSSYADALRSPPVEDGRGVGQLAGAAIAVAKTTLGGPPSKSLTSALAELEQLKEKHPEQRAWLEQLGEQIARLGETSWKDLSASTALGEARAYVKLHKKMTETLPTACVPAMTNIASVLSLGVAITDLQERLTERDAVGTAEAGLKCLQQPIATTHAILQVVQQGTALGADVLKVLARGHVAAAVILGVPFTVAICMLGFVLCGIGYVNAGLGLYETYKFREQLSSVLAQDPSFKGYIQQLEHLNWMYCDSSNLNKPRNTQKLIRCVQRDVAGQLQERVPHILAELKKLDALNQEVARVASELDEGAIPEGTEELLKRAATGLRQQAEALLETCHTQVDKATLIHSLHVVVVCIVMASLILGLLVALSVIAALPLAVIAGLGALGFVGAMGVHWYRIGLLKEEKWPSIKSCIWTGIKQDGCAVRDAVAAFSGKVVSLIPEQDTQFSMYPYQACY